jgi:hypothetical protein
MLSHPPISFRLPNPYILFRFLSMFTTVGMVTAIPEPMT